MPFIWRKQLHYFALIWKSAVVFRAERGGKPHEIYRAGMGFEMNNLLTVRIQDKMTSFSKGQRLIAKYILEHYDKVAFMTAARLGATVGGERIYCGAFCHRDRLYWVSGVAAGHARDDPE